MGETTDYRAGILNLVLLIVSTGLWINLIRLGMRCRWSWTVEPRRPVPWRPFEAVLFIVVVLLCVTALLEQLFHLPEAPPHTLRHLQVNTLRQVMESILVVLILGMWCRCQWGDFGIRRQGLLEDLRFGLWGVLLAQLPVQLVSYPLRSLRSAKPHVMLQLLQDSQHDLQMMIWIAVAVVIMAPVIEELLFRVLLQGAMEREVAPVWAITLTSAAFVSTHAMVDWAPLLPLALILGYVYYRRHSLLAVVVLHSLFNAVNLMSAIWNLKPPEVSP